MLFNFYSLDSRGGNIKIATHSAIANDLGQRLFFTIGDNLRDSYLQIRDVKPTDGGIYRCRVDFFNFPSRNYRINISLVGMCLIQNNNIEEHYIYVVTEQKIENLNICQIYSF